MLAGFHALGAELDAGAISEGCPLEIGVFALVSRRVVLGSTNTVGVCSDDDGSFVAGWTDFCHNFLV